MEFKKNDLKKTFVDFQKPITGDLKKATTMAVGEEGGNKFENLFDEETTPDTGSKPVGGFIQAPKPDVTTMAVGEEGGNNTGIIDDRDLIPNISIPAEETGGDIVIEPITKPEDTKANKKFNEIKQTITEYATADPRPNPDSITITITDLSEDEIKELLSIIQEHLNTTFPNRFKAEIVKDKKEENKNEDKKEIEISPTTPDKDYFTPDWKIGGDENHNTTMAVGEEGGSNFFDLGRFDAIAFNNSTELTLDNKITTLAQHSAGTSVEITPEGNINENLAYIIDFINKNYPEQMTASIIGNSIVVKKV